YADLPSEAAAAVRRLGLLPARTFGPDVVAAVCAVDRAEGTRLLEILLSASLVQDVRADDERDGPLTCGFHDVIGDLAQDRAGEEPQEVRDEVLRRWVEWHLRAATEAEARLTPSHRTMPRSYRYIVTDLELFAQDSEQTVVEWLDRHRADLLAAVDVAVAAGWDELSSQIADAMWPLFLRRRHNEDLVAVHEKTLPAAERAGDLRMMRRMLTTLGGGLRSLGRYDEALERYDQALAGARRDGDRLDEAQALDGIGEVHRQAGRTGQAVAPLTQALAIREEIGYTRGAALTRLRLGEIADDNEEWHDALTYLVRARAELLAVPDPYDAARALAVLGRVYTRSGHYTAGVAQLHQAEDEFAEAGSHHWQARAREWTGAAAYNEGRTAEARDHLTAAREMYEHVHSTRDIARIDQHLLALDGEA
ncbi:MULTISPECIES: tetratricopeptide repeat protein, partial [unclassified Streptomyces]|uniref:tetratricopeptide repeat protein n=1 Tax=unclassified Streptomyces TaxID=2593676 RepID=UPI00081E622F